MLADDATHSILSSEERRVHAGATSTQHNKKNTDQDKMISRYPSQDRTETNRTNATHPPTRTCTRTTWLDLITRSKRTSTTTTTNTESPAHALHCIAFHCIPLHSERHQHKPCQTTEPPDLSSTTRITPKRQGIVYRMNLSGSSRERLSHVQYRVPTVVVYYRFVPPDLCTYIRCTRSLRNKPTQI